MFAVTYGSDEAGWLGVGTHTIVYRNRKLGEESSRVLKAGTKGSGDSEKNLKKKEMVEERNKAERDEERRWKELQ